MVAKYLVGRFGAVQLAKRLVVAVEPRLGQWLRDLVEASGDQLGACFDDLRFRVASRLAVPFEFSRQIRQGGMCRQGIPVFRGNVFARLQTARKNRLLNVCEFLAFRRGGRANGGHLASGLASLRAVRAIEGYLRKHSEKLLSAKSSRS